MHIIQSQYRSNLGWNWGQPAAQSDTYSSLVLVFGSRELLENSNNFRAIEEKYPESHIILATTSGEIAGNTVQDDSIVVTKVDFEKTTIKVATRHIDHTADSLAIAKSLAEELLAPDLKYVMVISDGQFVNGSKLVSGFSSIIPHHIAVTGGLAGDAARFEKTLVGYNQAPESGWVVAAGFYGDSLLVGHGSVGGWETFGPERMVTASENNELFELDGQNALSIYKKYLGNYASELPGAALLFPLSISVEGNKHSLTRTILRIDEEKQSMIFAGDMPLNARVRFMKANFDKLIDGSEEAARTSVLDFDDFEPDLALLVSCVGRKLILDQRVEEEVEVVRELIGANAAITGFYSYGEISPSVQGTPCELHNQTMTITTLKEL